MEFNTGHVEVNCVTFQYLEAGRGPLVLCLHGFPGQRLHVQRTPAGPGRSSSSNALC